MKAFYSLFFLVGLSSCVHSSNQRDVANTDDLCEQVHIGNEVLEFKDTNVGMRSDVKVLSVSSSDSIGISNLSINGVQFPFVYAIGGRARFDDSKNCPSPSNVTWCHIHLAFEPIEAGEYVENGTVLRFLANGQECTRSIKMTGKAIE